MSLTRTSSSWPSSNVVVRISAGSWRSPRNISSGADATVGRRCLDRLRRRVDGTTLRRLAGGRTCPRRTAVALAHRGEDLGDLLLVERLALEQGPHQTIEDVAVLDQDVERFLVRGLDEPANLLVDLAGDILGVVALVAHVAAEEGFGPVGAELDRTQPLGHAVLGDHAAGQGARPLDVLLGTRGGVVEDQFLGGP